MPRPKSILPFCFLPAPAPRIPGPAAPYTTGRKALPAPSFVPGLKESCAAPPFPCSCGPAVASLHSRAARPARSCLGQSGWPRALPASAAWACPVWRPEPAPLTPPALAAACTARARASRSIAIGKSAHPSATSPDPSAPSPIERTIPASRGRRPPRLGTRLRPFPASRARRQPFRHAAGRRRLAIFQERPFRPPHRLQPLPGQ